MHWQVAPRSILCDQRRQAGSGGAKNALSNVDFTKPIGDGPITRGFDHYFGTIVPNYPPYCFIENDQTVGIPSAPLAGENFNIPGPAVPGWKLENILPSSLDML